MIKDLLRGESMSPVEYYTWKYPQLTLPIKEGMKDSEEYGNIVKAGIFPENLACFMKENGLEERIPLNTPAGYAEALYLPERDEFEYYYKALSNRCEPMDIPLTTGAVMISGINSWRRIYAHKEEFLQNHSEEEWDAEFDIFISDKNNFRDSVLLLSKGEYSHVSYERTGFTESEWIDMSKKIRLYHEMTHFVSRKLYPEHQEAVRDEVLADSIGIIGALGKFEPQLERLVLGIENGICREDGRLRNYVDEIMVDKATQYADLLISELSDFYSHNNFDDPFDYLLEAEEQKIGIRN